MVKNEEVKTIELYLEKRHVKTEDGKEFDAFKTPIGKLNLDVKFRKDAEIPSKSGYYKFDVSTINLNTKKEYPCLWIAK